MKIAIPGVGAAGVASAIALKRTRQRADVTGHQRHDGAHRQLPLAAQVEA